MAEDVIGDNNQQDQLIVDGLTLEQNINRLDEDQREIFDLAIINKESLLIHGKAGCGKSALLNVFRQYFHTERIRFIVVAPTGTAAAKVGGRTIESAFGLGSVRGRFLKDMTRYQASEIIKNRVLDAKARLKQMHIPTGYADLQVIMIDEFSMCHIRLFEMLDELLRDIRETDKPFGGVQILVFADFKQLLPVPSKESRIQYESSDEILCLSSEQSWYGENGLRPTIKCLTRQHRQDEDPEFEALLCRMRDGQMTEADHQLLEARSREFIPFYQLTLYVLERYTIADKDTIMNINRFIGDVPLPAQICSLRKECEDRNSTEFGKLDRRTEQTFYASIKFVPNPKKRSKKPLSDKQLKLRDLMVKESMQNSRINDKVSLRINTRVMLLRNLDVERFITTGCIGTVVSFAQTSSVPPQYIPQVLFDSNPSLGPVSVAPYAFSFSPDGMPGGGTVYVTQMPFIHAWAATTHSVQGATLTSAIIEAKKFFADGQFYTALSRLKKFAGAIIKDYSREIVKINEFVHVYMEPYEQEGRERNSRKRPRSD